ncbi:stage II sporulation protein M [Candidatus Woesearchaeota archaeon]|nr:stage II sporulation protein M [Candidatus Woesearchaeota archaeon]
MVLESLINPLRAEAHPRILFVHGFLYASLGLFLGYWIFSVHASLIMVFLTTMAAIPLVYNIIKTEEKKELSDLDETNLLREHAKALSVFMYYFIGATLGFAFWYVVLPSSMIGGLFEVQTQTITDIRSNITGNSYQSFKVFTEILSNNLKVLIFCVLFSFIYGLGAIFILTWNASVIGVAIGNFIRTELQMISGGLNLQSAAGYFQVISIGLFRYVIHGIPEILSYFFAGLAGGIISIAVIRHDFGTKKYEKIILDSSILLLLSLFFVLVAAVLEVYVTPIFF